jgi:hypothetical protein
MHVAIPDLTAKLSDRARAGRGNTLLSRRLDDRAGITPIAGYLRRRVGDGRRAEVARHPAAPGHESI